MLVQFPRLPVLPSPVLAPSTGGSAWTVQGVFFHFQSQCSVVQSCLTPCDPRLLCPQDCLSKNAGVGCHFLLQRIFQTQGLNLHLLQLLHQQADSFPRHHLGSPWSVLTKGLMLVRNWSSCPVGTIGDIRSTRVWPKNCHQKLWFLFHLGWGPGTSMGKMGSLWKTYQGEREDKNNKNFHTLWQRVQFYTFSLKNHLSLFALLEIPYVWYTISTNVCSLQSEPQTNRKLARECYKDAPKSIICNNPNIETIEMPINYGRGNGIVVVMERNTTQ